MSYHTQMESHPLSPHSLGELCGQFLETCRTQETRRAYKRFLDQFLESSGLMNTQIARFMATPPGETRFLCETFLAPLIKRDPHGGEILTSSRRDLARNALASFFRYLVEEFGYTRNPIQNIPNIRALTKSNTDYLSPEEMIHFLLVLRGKASKSEGAMRDYLLITGMFLEALRRAELRRLKWDHFDFEEKVLRVRVKRGKEKINPVPAHYLNRLFDFRVRYGKDSTYVFRPLRQSGPEEKPLSHNAVYRIVVGHAKGLFPNKNITPHSLRTTYITTGHLWGANLKDIQNGAGLATLEMVGYYDRRNQTEHNFTNQIGDFLTERGVFDL